MLWEKLHKYHLEIVYFISIHRIDLVEYLKPVIDAKNYSKLREILAEEYQQLLNNDSRPRTVWIFICVSGYLAIMAVTTVFYCVCLAFLNCLLLLYFDYNPRIKY